MSSEESEKNSQKDSEKNSICGFFGKFFRKSVETVEEAASTVGEAAGKVGKAVGTAGGWLVSGLELLGQSLINTTRFLTDSKYRNEEVYPWLQSTLESNWEKVKQELGESQEMMLVLWKYSHGHDLSEKEKKEAKEQLGDIIKVVPALAIFALPGGAILLPLLARALPWNLMPSSFQDQVKQEYGEDSLSKELKEDEEIPVDEGAQLSEEVTKQAEKNVQQLVEEHNNSTKQDSSENAQKNSQEKLEND